MGISTTKLTWPNILWQPLLSFFYVVAVLYLFSFTRQANLAWAVGVGAIASSTYLVFGTPSLRSARPRNILGGYCIAIVCSMVIEMLVSSMGLWCSDFFHCSSFTVTIFISSLVIALVLVFMAALRCQHPPAAGLALTLVIDSRDYDLLLFVSVSVLVLAGIAYMLRNRLRDLVE